MELLILPVGNHHTLTPVIFILGMHCHSTVAAMPVAAKRGTFKICIFQ